MDLFASSILSVAPLDAGAEPIGTGAILEFCRGLLEEQKCNESVPKQRTRLLIPPLAPSAFLSTADMNLGLDCSDGVCRRGLRTLRLLSTDKTTTF